MRDLMIIITIWALATGCTPKGSIETSPAVSKEIYVNPLWEDYLKEDK